MFVHIGEETLIRAGDIIAIIDRESAAASSVLAEFLSRREEEIINLSKSQYKSIVITDKQIFYSPLAAGTLKKRSRKLTVQEF